MLLATGALLASSSSAAQRSPTTKPTIVLVHGAWADASSWDGVIPRLQADGYTVMAPANPSSASARRDIAWTDSAASITRNAS